MKQYFWTFDGETTQSHDSLSAGEYTVLVTDSNACSAFATFQVSDNNGPSITLLSIAPATCNGGSDGGALIQVASVNGTYKIQWSTSENDTLEEITNVSGGFYTVSVTDSLGCMSYDTIEVTQPNTFNVNLNIVNTHCGALEGSAATVVTGGTTPYFYTWTYGIANRGPLETSSYIEHVNSGEGNVIVTDYHGCTTSKKFEILDIGGISVTGNVITNPTCFLDTTGSARVIVSGGTAPYYYSWYPSGGNKDTAVNLISDIYTVTVIDGNGCRQKTSLLIDSPDELKAYIFGNITSADTVSDGAAYSVVYGGSPPYSYLWSNGSTKEFLTGLNIGSDSLVVTDSHGCIARNSVVIKGECYSGTHTMQSACTIDSFVCPSCTTSVTRNIKTDFGAVGNGESDDECAFERASEFFSNVGATVPKKLIIPYGTYLVGRQDIGIGGSNDVLFFNNMENLTIQGIPIFDIDIYGHILKTRLPKMINLSCMYYGAFDFTGTPPYKRYLIDLSDTLCLSAPLNTLAVPGVMIRLYNCKNVAINYLELDGNIDNTFIGGANNGDGYQLYYDGIDINASKDVRINYVNAHHFGRDGLYVNYLDYCIGDDSYPRIWPVMDMKINNSKFQYNGRMNMTWAGGIGLTVTNSEFNYAGQSRIRSKPSSGVDIEYELSNVPNNNGYFENCKFKYNASVGMISDNTALNRNRDYWCRNVTFKKDTFVSSENGITAWPNSRNFEFYLCGFYGQTLGAYASYLSGPDHTRPVPLNHDNTKFFSCYFSEHYSDPYITPPKT